MNNEVIKGKCIDLSSEGKGVVRFDKDVVFVNGLLPGEEAEIVLLFKRAGVYFGEIKRLISKSPDRIIPRCKVATACGGCSFQQYSYKAQLAYKTKKVKEAFLRIAGIDVNVPNCIGMDDPYNYRNKTQMPVKKDRFGNMISGFYKEKSHEIVAIDHCDIEDLRSSKIMSTIKELMKSFDVKPYDEDRRTGVVRHILIRTSHYKNQIMVVLVTNTDSFPGRNNFIKALLEKHPEITTIVQNTNSRDTNVILGNFENILYGKGFIEDTLCGLSFQISSKSFYQINPIQTEKLYTIAIEGAKLSKEDVVLDAYSGIGTIGLIASKYVKKVLSVEVVGQAVRDGIRNARRNNVTNVEFHEADASDYILQLSSDKTSIDVVIMDPPRTGSDDKFLNSVLTLLPKKVVYVSCDPATLARDIKKLSIKYDVTSVQPVDMFPMTFHVEAVVCLSLKK